MDLLHLFKTDKRTHRQVDYNTVGEKKITLIVFQKTLYKALPLSPDMLLNLHSFVCKCLLQRLDVRLSVKSNLTFLISITALPVKTAVIYKKNEGRRSKRVGVNERMGEKEKRR